MFTQDEGVMTDAATTDEATTTEEVATEEVATSDEEVAAPAATEEEVAA